MGDIDRIESEQSRIWNGHAGRTWAEEQELLDDVFRPFEPLLTGPAGGCVLDVGCGTGGTTLAIARANPGSHCTGIDISAPMIDLARQRAAGEALPADFLCADAERHDFEAGRFDTIVSRFGVMFFDDPVGAFANLRRSARNDGRLRFIAWRSPAENAFMTAAERAAAVHLPGLPPRKPGAPGQFAFADRARMLSVLKESGWSGIAVEPIDVECTMPRSKLASYYTKMGPVGLHLRQADQAARTQLLPRLEAAFHPFVRGDEARFTAACWLVDAWAA